MTRCYRCNTGLESERMTVMANDTTAATVAHYEGAVCPSCWEKIVACITGHGYECGGGCQEYTIEGYQ